MTNAQASTSLSVRGEAQRTTAPDEAQVFSTVSTTAESTSAASSQVRSALAGLLADLGELGGQVLTVHTTRTSLTWSVQSMQTQQEYTHNKTTGESGPTGRHQSSIALHIVVRDFALLERVSATMTSDDAVQVHSVSWSVDEDNSEWAQVRADAIRAALLKGRDYAAALGGKIIRVDHVADAGLLGGDSGGWATRTRGVSLSAMGSSGGEVSLDPVPQVLHATIEARFTAEVGALPGR